MQVVMLKLIDGVFSLVVIEINSNVCKLVVNEYYLLFAYYWTYYDNCERECRSMLWLELNIVRLVVVVLSLMKSALAILLLNKAHLKAYNIHNFFHVASVVSKAV